MKRTRILWMALLFCAASVLRLSSAEAADYRLPGNWACFGAEENGKAADVFFVCPAVLFGNPDDRNMDFADETARANFLGATNMEKGIYDGDARFFAPYYRLAALSVYELPGAEREPYLKAAYADVRAAFLHYLANHNHGRPIILAGFSQGGDHVLRLLKEFFGDGELREHLVAAYVLGWRVTAADLAAAPHLRLAEGERDTGVIVTFNTEAANVKSSLLIPERERAFAINPLNWRTDGARATKATNHGACFTDYSGAITKEIPELTGAYIDPCRGALKATDVSPKDYPPILSIFSEGVYHIYDYQFFYRNLQENVAARLDAYLSAREEEEAE